MWGTENILKISEAIRVGVSLLARFAPRLGFLELCPSLDGVPLTGSPPGPQCAHSFLTEHEALGGHHVEENAPHKVRRSCVRSLQACAESEKYNEKY